MTTSHIRNNGTPLGILDLLTLRGFDRDCKAKLVRHQDARWPLEEMYRGGWLEIYQAYQLKPWFDRCDFIVSFLGTSGTRAKFIGVYEVGAKNAGTTVPIPKECPYQDISSKNHYALRKVNGFDDFEGRVIIDWGKGTRSWVQRLRDKPVIEILPGIGALATFRDYQDFVLQRHELERVFADPEAHREWRARLSAVAGVYLILDSLSGKQYIGSASGAEGIWGRWSEYAKTGHGNNDLLRDLVDSSPHYPAAFQYSILQVLPKSMTRADVIRWEIIYKQKLGTRATGLNLN